ncbi:unnamed protein product, partial [Vitis vinifera]|uniref:Uncharacterized protein n=1 Tax=Vitis vinifera TaxID=29760 RepID=D7TQ36_VITVI
MVKKIKIFYYGRVWFLVLPFHIRRVDTCKEANCRVGIVGAVRTTSILGQPGLAAGSTRSSLDLLKITVKG